MESAASDLGSARSPHNGLKISKKKHQRLAKSGLLVNTSPSHGERLLIPQCRAACIASVCSEAAGILRRKCLGLLRAALLSTPSRFLAGGPSAASAASPPAGFGGPRAGVPGRRPTESSLHGDQLPGVLGLVPMAIKDEILLLRLGTCCRGLPDAATGGPWRPEVLTSGHLPPEGLVLGQVPLLHAAGHLQLVLRAAHVPAGAAPGAMGGDQGGGGGGAGGPHGNAVEVELGHTDGALGMLEVNTMVRLLARGAHFHVHIRIHLRLVAQLRLDHHTGAAQEVDLPAGLALLARLHVVSHGEDSQGHILGEDRLLRPHPLGLALLPVPVKNSQALAIHLVAVSRTRATSLHHIVVGLPTVGELAVAPLHPNGVRWAVGGAGSGDLHLRDSELLLDVIGADTPQDLRIHRLVDERAALEPSPAAHVLQLLLLLHLLVRQRHVLTPGLVLHALVGPVHPPGVQPHVVQEPAALGLEDHVLNGVGDNADVVASLCGVDKPREDQHTLVVPLPAEGRHGVVHGAHRAVLLRVEELEVLAEHLGLARVRHTPIHRVVPRPREIAALRRGLAVTESQALGHA
mmetsp:Transcript_113043/g.258959  ORF Transcript_113043/g.258959 Transcript_113043/m.258959 type:complete len:575 (-) Transcript_113043:2147-3871(-)